MNFPLCFYSKQNQLWIEGDEYYKENGQRPEHHEYGIYSTKRRENAKSLNCISLQSTSKGEHSFSEFKFISIFVAAL